MHICIIGMGPAAISAVQAIREEDTQIRISMFSAEDSPPYSPPCLGHFVCTGETGPLFWQGEDIGSKYQVTCYPGTPIVGLDPDHKRLVTQSGQSWDFEALIIASGSSLYAPVPGADQPGILQFKNLAGAQALRRMALEAKQRTVVIVGGGFIGVEIALYLAKLGVRPILLNRRGWIMPRLLDPDTAEYVWEDLSEQGVDVRLNTEGIEFGGQNGVDYLLTNSGEKLRADAYIAATGVKPNIGFVHGTDIEVDEGVLVDDCLQTSRPGIFACGDAAQARELLSGERRVLGLYPVAVQQGWIAGKNALGRKQTYQPQPSMNSLKGLSFQLVVVGRQQGQEIVSKGRDWMHKFFMHNDKLQGFVLLGDISQAGAYMSLLQNQRDLRAPSPKYLEALCCQ
ncbi:MAG: FAD-dependent oxidoreductase [Desulfovermiculus sp.]|nr:FAD-dependent oxidoreductase [Desulfovermiculus sp.]